MRKLRSLLHEAVPTAAPSTHHAPGTSYPPRLRSLIALALLTGQGLWAQVTSEPTQLQLGEDEVTITRASIPDVPYVVRLYWNPEQPFSSEAVPLGPFSVSYEANNSMTVSSAFDATAYDQGFFFVETSSGNPRLTTDLSATPTQLAEGSDARLDINIGTGLSYEHYVGDLEFTLSGTGSLYGETLPLTRLASFAGANRTTPVLDLDDREITGARQVVLRVSGAQVTDDAEQEKVITIEDDDYYWSGAVTAGLRQFPIRVAWTHASAGPRLTYLSDGRGVIPAGSYDQSNGGPITGLEVPLIIPSAVQQSGPAGLDGDLTVAFSNLQEDGTTVEGDALVTVTYAAAPHLNTTAAGTFILRREAHPIEDRNPAFVQ